MNGVGRLLFKIFGREDFIYNGDRFFPAKPDNTDGADSGRGGEGDDCIFPAGDGVWHVTNLREKGEGRREKFFYYIPVNLLNMA